MKMGFKVPVALALFSVAGYASASVTALSFIPIADILGHREAVVSYLAFGNERNIDKATTHYSWVNVGVGDVAEVAFSDDLNKGQATHLKVKLYEEGSWAFSAGASNYEGRGLMCDPFLVGRYDLKDVRFHFGYLRNDTHRGFFGVEFPLFGTCTGSLEWMTGPESYGWASINVPIKQLPGLNFWLGGGIPSDGKTQGIQHQVGFWYGFKM